MQGRFISAVPPSLRISLQLKHANGHDRLPLLNVHGKSSGR
jgi:hypothetical protein